MPRPTRSRRWPRSPARRVRRVLTSGGAVDCRTGRDALERMARELRGSVELMAGGGVDVGDIPMLAAAGVDAVHLSARIRATGGGSGGPGGGEAGFDVTDARVVRAAVAAAGGLTPSPGPPSAESDAALGGSRTRVDRPHASGVAAATRSR